MGVHRCSWAHRKPGPEMPGLQPEGGKARRYAAAVGPGPLLMGVNLGITCKRGLMRGIKTQCVGQEGIFFLAT